MGKIAAVAILLSVLLAFGCIAEDAPAQQNATPDSTGVKTMPTGVQNYGDDAGANETSPILPPPAQTQNGTEAASCLVDFQRGMGETYYVMVKTDSGGEITVKCPDNTWAERTGNAFFCEKLALPSPVVAYLDGASCGSAKFARDEPREGGAKGMCTISVTPKKIVAGDSVTVSVYASTGGAQATLSYDCGSGEKSTPAVGIYTGTSICRYDTAGAVSVTARLNGLPCSSANLTIYATKRGCSVQQEPMRYSFENGENVYRGTVFGHGYNADEELYYRCFGEVYNVRIGNIPSSSDFEYAVECRSKSNLTEPVRVTISKIECGSINP
ncbi:MAG: hypothetical protein WCT52_04155 [Candidatus Micrarchaeia archaeon]